MLKKTIFFTLITINIILPQFDEISIEINQGNLNDNQIFSLENLENEINDYFINNQFLIENEEIELELIIDVILFIESINNKGSEYIISGQFFFSNRRDQYLVSKGFDFSYSKGEGLVKSIMFDPLASLLDFYANILIANELDTYEYLGGHKYFLKAENICSEAKRSNFSKNWKDRLKKVRKLKDNYEYRELRYSFFTTWDILSEEKILKEDAAKFFTKFYHSIIDYDQIYGHGKPITQFLNAYCKEIVEFAKILNNKDIVNYLIMYDEANREIYRGFFVK